MMPRRTDGPDKNANKDPVVDDYAKQAVLYDEKWAFYTKATIRETIPRIPLKSGQSLLDIGCGTGALLKALSTTRADVRLTGVDPTPEMLALARRRLPDYVELKDGRAEALPCENATFDVVVSCNMFHYLREPERALEEAKRVLKPDGALVVTDWCDDYLACKLCHAYLSFFDPAHFTIYGTEGCRKMLLWAGLRDVEVNRYKINWLWGMMTAVGRR